MAERTDLTILSTLLHRPQRHGCELDCSAVTGRRARPPRCLLPAAWIPAWLVLASWLAAGQPPALADDAAQAPAPAAEKDPAPSAAPAPEAGSARPPASLPLSGELARCKRLIDAGLYAGARARLELTVEQHPDWARAIALLALTYYKESRFELAKPLFAQALAADPEEIAVRPFYGWTLYSLGELDAAQEMFASLLERMPEYAAGHYALGVIHLQRDEVGPARERFETTVRLAAGQGDSGMEGRAHARLGELSMRLNDLSAAKRELEVAVELFPGDPDALFQLSRVLQRLGDSEGAERARERFEEVKARAQPGAAWPPG